MISRTMRRRSSRVSGVRSSVSCSVTSRRTALGQVLARLGREELRPELRDARVVDTRLQLGVRVRGRALRPRLLADRRVDVASAIGLLFRPAAPFVAALDPVVEAHR